MLHMDLFGPTSVRSINHKTYCLVVTDDYSRFSWVFFLATKDETSGILKTFITGIENQINHKVKIIRCDNGTEFKNNDMNQFCGMKGIKREFSVARTPQQNGVAERKNRTLIEAARTMLADSLLPTTFWAEAVSTACYVQNRVLVTKPHNKTPYELLHGSGPEWLFDIDSLTKSMNYEPVTAGNQTNGDAGIETNVNAGQARQEKASDHEYILLPLMLSNSPLSSSSQSTDNKDADEKEGFDNVDDQERIDSSTQDVNTVRPSINTASENINTRSSNINTASPIPNDPSMQSWFGLWWIFQKARDTPKKAAIELRGVRKRKDERGISPTITTAPLETTHDDFFSDETEVDMSNITIIYPVPSNPNTRIHKDHSLDHVIGDEEPKKVIQALKDPSWIDAMQEELLQFKLQQVWTLVDLPYGKRAIGTKLGLTETIKNERVARIKAIMLFLAYASFKDFVVYQMDVKSAFLYGKIKEVYVCRPPGFEDPKFTDKVYKVEKALYGLHQAPRACDKYMDEILKKFDFSTVKTTSAPMETSKPLLKDTEAEDVDVHLYISMIGSLMYLTASSKSTTGGCQFLGRRLISWQCKKQTIVANSTTEAEYVVVASCCG
ncbi:putative ribonuclease H-like domain-containing protein [Tanacetum coccineum]